MSAIFLYTTVTNIYERPEGIKIASFFIAAIVVVSLSSRAIRSTELARIRNVAPERQGRATFLDEHRAARRAHHRPPPRQAHGGGVRHEGEPGARGPQPGRRRAAACSSRWCRATLRTSARTSTCAASRWAGTTSCAARARRCPTPSRPCCSTSATASSTMPQAYFGWTEGNPIAYVLRYLILGEGDTAPVTREILRRAIKNPRRAAEDPRRLAATSRAPSAGTPRRCRTRACRVPVWRAATAGR